MVARRVPFLSRFIALVVVLYSSFGTLDAKGNHGTCAPSSCGNVLNISYPFRLEDDPENCGDPRYNLSCEHNLTVLYLKSGRYYVQAINYDNYTIRVVDDNVLKGNCSSIPRYPLTRYNFSDGEDAYSIQVKKIHRREIKWRWPSYLSSIGPPIELSKPIIFITCETSVSSSRYVDTAPCIDAMSSLNSKIRGKSFVTVGQLIASDLRGLCRIDLMAMTSGPPSTREIMNMSYIDIHSELAYGFELSWLQSYDKGRSHSTCYIIKETNKVHCVDDCGFLTWPNHSCGIMDYILGILSDLLDIILKIATCYFQTRTLLGILCLIVLIIRKWKRRHLSMYGHIEEFLQSDNNLVPIRYSYSDIRKMTRGFKDKLGEGGYGSVYKGKLRTSKRLIAVKMLGKSKANGQDFINEVATIGRIHHVNVVHLIGYCAEGSKRALVYEFMPNGSLDKHIFPKEGLVSLSYRKALEISLGVARGIDYLHKGCDMQILHFDIKPHNILLDENFIPKVSDFGLARLCPLNDSSLGLTAARGTIGYIAPELFYRNIGGVSNKADIYSFGMMLMEIAGKRKNLNAVAAHSSQIYFPSWVYDQLGEGKEIEVEEDATEEEKKIAKKMLMVALWCIQLKPSDRPNSMSRVVEMLEAELECLQMPPKPFLYPQEKPVVEDDEDYSETASS